MNSSSLVDLKAELARKQEQFRKDRQKNASGFIRPKPTQKKATLWSKQNAGVQERAQRDAEQIQEENNALDASRSKLEEKAKLYEKMTGTIPEESTSKVLLVDFEKKTVDSLLAKRLEDRKQEEEDKREEERKEREEVERLLQENVPPPLDPNEQWVDYVDSLGRSRRCLKKDLAHLQEMDADLQGKPVKSKTAVETSGGKQMMSADMIREEQRLKWEQEAEEEMHGPIHYANVNHNEIRTHGVGFYKFAKDDDTRQDQMESLNQLRAQTVDGRDKRERLKAKRQAVLQDRLAKVRQRKLVKEGGQAVDEAFDVIGPKQPDVVTPTPEPLTRDDTLKKDASSREWDQGKPVVDVEEAYVDKRREERDDDFAPPQFYYNAPKAKPAPAKSKTATKSASSAIATDFMKSLDANLQAIRTQMNSQPQQEMKTELQADLSDIPLPQESLPSEASHTMPTTVPPVPTDVPYSGPASDMNYSQVPVYPDTSYSPGGYFNNGGWFIDANAQFMPPAQPVVPPHYPAYGYTGVPPGMQVPFMTQPTAPTVQSIPEHWRNSNAEPLQETLQEAPQDTYQPNTSSQDPADSPDNQPSTLPLDSADPTSVFLPPISTVHTASETVAPDSGVIQPGPQPAHYSSAPSKTVVKKAKYHHIPLHQLPPTLPAPPTTGQSVQYPSQEDVFGSTKSKNKGMSEDDAVRRWQRQFQFKASDTSDSAGTSQESAETSDHSKSAQMRPANIPFASPYIQTQSTDTGKDEVKFDPSKPPPST